MKTIKVKLGGVEYEIKPLPMRPAREWRKKLEGTFDDVFTLLGGASDLKIETAADLGQIVMRVKGLLLGAVDRVVDLVFTFSPELSARRQEIEEVATDEEAVEALLAIIGLAYPFSLIAEKFQSLTSGPANTATSKNSQGPSGASG